MFPKNELFSYRSFSSSTLNITVKLGQFIAKNALKNYFLGKVGKIH